MPQSTPVAPRPLYWPDGTRPPEPWGIYCAFYAAIVGGFVAGCAANPGWAGLGVASVVGLAAFHERNGRGTVDRLADQLRRRPSFPAGAWGPGERAAFARRVSRIVADELGWPNAHFLPDDPLALVLYCPGGDGGEGLAIADDFRATFGRACAFAADTTFSEFVDRNLARGALTPCQ